MNIELNYQPRTTYKGYAISVATGIGGHYARTSMVIDEDTTHVLEVGPNDTEQGALQAARRSIQDVLYAEGMAEEPSPHFPG